MKCEVCGKNEANVRYYENINGEKKELHVCSSCANKLGFSGFSNIFSPLFTMNFKDFDLEDEEQVCKRCGYSFEDYAKTGLFGCPECYSTFKDKLDSLFLKMNGVNEHVHKKIGKGKEKIREKTNDEKLNKIDKLKIKLKEHVEKEEYEEAAKIRDEIKKLEK